ncbi:MAG: DUF2845 domain-containing protein [Gammaproteobacteria bacterium]|nr:DUF2845 domain-containing protein [Gammaproteobacteria bacterium]MCW5582818.1 DUF2845 domain-containing protein [Gammaproteobacteria bacterium]
MNHTHPMSHTMYLALITIALAIFPNVSAAFFCPSNFNQIDFGMTPDEVTQTCGKPDEQKESTKENENIPQEWSYYIQQTVSIGGSNSNPQGTLKTTITFDDTGKAINISVNGIGVGASSICGSNIQLGDTRDKVKSACGDPAAVSKLSSTLSGTSAQQEPIKVLEFHYSSGTPPTVLIFENGKLTDKQ